MDPSEVEIQADSAGSGRADGVTSGIPAHQRTLEDLRRSQEELLSPLISVRPSGADHLWVEVPRR